MEALTAGTIHGAMLMKSDHETGSLDVGKYGDIVLVKGNPLDDIRILENDQNIEIVMINGSIVKNLIA
jgi:imidazolonepropionase-like amidohydrolase